MYSQEEYLVFAKEFLSPQSEKCREQMAVILNKKGNETRDALLSVMEQLFQQCIRQQKEGVKKPIRYIHFFYLNLAVLTGCYDIQINAFSEESYMDKMESIEFWNPSFITDLYKKDMEELEIEGKRQVIHFGYPQMLEIKERSYLLYVMMTGQYLASLSEEIAGIPAFGRMEKAEGLQMVFGGYMDTGIQIWPKIRQEEEKIQEGIQ